MTLLLREEDLDQTVRSPINKKEANKLLEHLDNWDGKVGNSWKIRATANQIVLESGDPFGYVDIYKGLSKLENEELELLTEPTVKKSMHKH